MADEWDHVRRGDDLDPENLTPFEFDMAFAYDIHGVAMVVLCVAGRFMMPKPGTATDAPLSLAEEQRRPSMADVHWADPASSSLRWPGQGLVHRPRPEIYLNGKARTPRGRPAREQLVGVRVGDCVKQLMVTGDRRWVRGPLGLRATSPEPFVELPLLYERAYGGTFAASDGGILSQEARNPVGVGAYPSASAAVDQPLPNLEAPSDRLRTWDQRAVIAGFGAVPASWQPRLAAAGTYDERWIEERAPLWPLDVRPEFFSASASGMLAPGPLRGGEIVRLVGMFHDGDIGFVLPTYRIIAKSYFGDRVRRAPLVMDAVLLEPEERAVTLIWRHVVPLGYGSRSHLRSAVRLLESWEDLPGGDRLN